MKKLLLLLTMSAPLFLQAQSIKNGSFETWSVVNFDNLDGWITSNEITIPQFGIPSVIKVNPGVTNFALKLESVASGVDTMFGFITNADDPISGDGGIPYSQKPTGISGNFRYNIMPNDTARIFIGVKNSGTMYASDMISIWGTQSTFSLNNYPLPNITASGITPDTVIIAITSSDFFNFPVAGSVLEVDNLVFTGAGPMQSINGDFDNWTPGSVTVLPNWDMSGGVFQTTDAFSGTYAAKLMSLDDGSFVEPASIQQEFAITTKVDTLVGYYKYITTGGDSASVEVHNFSMSGPPNSIIRNFGPASSYTQFKIPLMAASGNDTNAIIIFQSSSWMGMQTDSTTLYLDSIHIKPGVVSVKNVAANSGIRVYPNPASDMLKIAIDKNAASEVSIVVYNAFGTEVYANTIAVKGGEAVVPVKQLATGIYIFEAKIGDAEYKGRFIKE